MSEIISVEEGMELVDPQSQRDGEIMMVGSTDPITPHEGLRPAVTRFRDRETDLGRLGRRRRRRHGRLPRRPLRIPTEINPHHIRIKNKGMLYAVHVPFHTTLISLIQEKYPQVSAFAEQPILVFIAIAMLVTFYAIGAATTLMAAADHSTNYKQLYHDRRLNLNGIIHLSGFLSSFFFLLVLLVSDKGSRQLGLFVLLIFIAIATYYSLKLIGRLVDVVRTRGDAILQAVNMFKQTFTQFMGFRSIEQQYSTGTTTSV